MNSTSAKSFSIPRQAVWEAWKQVRSNGGSYGIDRVSIEDFEENLGKNLYKIWNRLASGSYFPPPVRRVEIPKENGKKRILGIPTVSDRVAQAVVLNAFHPMIEPIFHKDSYGYRTGKSAHDAVSVTKSRCWKYPFIIEFDIIGLFDNIPHDLLEKAIDIHCNDRWIRLYLDRWLKGVEESRATVALYQVLKESRKEVLSGLYLVTCLCTTPSTGGWRDTFREILFAGMLMMAWFTPRI